MNNCPVELVGFECATLTGTNCALLKNDQVDDLSELQNVTRWPKEYLGYLKTSVNDRPCQRKQEIIKAIKTELQRRRGPGVERRG